MSATVRWSGLEELKAQLRSLPADLAGEASGIVGAAATEARTEIALVYAAHVGPTGNLARGLQPVATVAGPVSASARLKNTAKHAWLFDNGSQARHWLSGKSTGRMWGRTPPTHVFVATIIRRRRQMYERLKALLVEHGLTVSGDV